MRLRTRFRRAVPEHSIAPHGGAPSILLLALLLLAAILGGPRVAAAAAAGCKLEKVAELPVTMSGLRPMVHAMINGNDALFIADSGASTVYSRPPLPLNLNCPCGRHRTGSQ
jgi:hypothetical protein